MENGVFFWIFLFFLLVSVIFSFTKEKGLVTEVGARVSRRVRDAGICSVCVCPRLWSSTTFWARLKEETGEEARESIPEEISNADGGKRDSFRLLSLLRQHQGSVRI